MKNTLLNFKIAVICLVMAVCSVSVTAQTNFGWAKDMGGTGGDLGQGVAVDGNGNVYVTGYFAAAGANFNPGGSGGVLSSAGGTDVFLAKYDTSGGFLWAKSMGGTGADWGYGVAVDDTGNVYVTGYFAAAGADFNPGSSGGVLSSAGGTDVFLAKYDTNGGFLWAKGAGGTGSDYGQGVAVDGNGNVYVTGYFDAAGADFNPGGSGGALSSAGSTDVFLAKYDAGSGFLWAKGMGGTGFDYGYGVAVDVTGNVCVTGQFAVAGANFNSGGGTLSSAGSDDVFLAKYDMGGGFLWAKSMGGTGVDWGYGVAVDGNGNVYVTGYFAATGADFDPGGSGGALSSAGGDDGFVVKYDASGGFVWAKSMGGTGADWGYGVAVDGDGNVYVTGYFAATGADFNPVGSGGALSSVGSNDGFVVKYDAGGGFGWAKSMGGTGIDYGSGVAVDGNGNVYVTGYFDAAADFNLGGSGGALTAAGSNDGFVVRFIDLATAAPCTLPPVAGTVVASTVSPCWGQSVNLGLNGNNYGLGQTYTWEEAFSVNGPFTTVYTSNNSSFTPPSVFGTSWYRCAVACGAATVYSDTLLITPNLGLPGGTYTINNTVLTGGTNFNSFADAAAALGCGITGAVVFDVAPGLYNERLVLDSIIGTSAVNTITFRGNGATLSYIATVSANRSTVFLSGADYIILDSLNIEANGTIYGWGVHLTNGADNDTIKNCTITVASTNTSAQTTAGIVASGSGISVTSAGNSDEIVILNNTITGAYQGVILAGGTSSKLVNNQIIGNTIKDFYAAGIILTHNTNPIVAGNDIKRDTRTTTATTLRGIELGAGNTQIKVDGNKIHDTHNAQTTQTGAAYGIHLNSCDAPYGQENIISNNLIYNFNSGSGIQNGLRNTGSDGAYFYHNTVVLDHATSTGGDADAFYLTAAATNIQLINNLFYITRSGTGTKHCLYFDGVASGIVSDYNVLYINAPAGTNYIAKDNGTDYSTLTTWQGTVGYDLNSQDANPMFAYTTAYDYTPTEPLTNNMCLLVGVITDINNNPRSTVSPDPGAFENNSFPLAVTLASIKAANAGTCNRIDWTTASEEDTRYFEIERSADSKTFTYLANLPAKGHANHYTYWDEEPFTGINYYRLKMYDKSGAYVYSKTVSAFVNKENAFMVEAFPNPVAHKLSVKIYGNLAKDAQIELLDVTGKLMSNQLITGQESVINTEPLAKGVYFIRYSDAVHVKTLKITKE